MEVDGMVDGRNFVYDSRGYEILSYDLYGDIGGRTGVSRLLVA